MFVSQRTARAQAMFEILKQDPKLTWVAQVEKQIDPEFWANYAQIRFAKQERFFVNVLEELYRCGGSNISLRGLYIDFLGENQVVLATKTVLSLLF